MTGMQPDPRPESEPESEVDGLPDTEGPVELSEELTKAVAEALDEGDLERAASLAMPLHAADQADLLEQLDREDRARGESCRTAERRAWTPWNAG